MTALTDREVLILVLAWQLGREFERTLLADLEAAADRAVRLVDEETAERWARYRDEAVCRA